MGLFPTFRSMTSNLTSPEKWLSDFFGGGSVSESGVKVSPDTMMSESAVWCAVNFLCSNIASLPCSIFKLDGRNKNKDRKHNLHKRLNNKANDEMISMVYRETMLYHLLFWGIHYSVIVRDGMNRITQLWPVHPDNVRLGRNAKKELVYFVMSDGNEIEYTRDKILHIPALGLNGLFGNATIDYAKDSIGLMIAMRSYANQFFANGAHMGVIFEHPRRLGEVAHKNLTNSLATAYSGLGKSHKAFVAEEGMKVVSAGTAPEKSQLIEGRQFAISDVARWFNLPPHVLKDLSKATFSNIEQQSLELVKFSIRVHLVRLEQSFEAWLLSDSEKETYKIRHNVEGLLRGDSAARAEFYTKLFSVGAITPNEIRGLEDLNPLPEKYADKSFTMLNMTPISDFETGSVEAETELKSNTYRESRGLERRGVKQIARARNRIKLRFQPLIREAVQKVVDHETESIQKEIAKQGGERSADDMETWLKSFYRDFPGFITKQLTPILRTFAESMQEVVSGEIDGDIGMNAELETQLRNYIDGFSGQYVDRSTGQMLQQLEIGIEAVEQRANEWQEKRANKVSMNETRGVASMVARVTILGAGYRLMWATNGKSCPFCNSLNGLTVSRMDEPFLKSGTEIDGGDSGKMTVSQTLYAPIHAGCDCNVIAG
jgi:HK97 family phage portal protein